MADKKKHMQAGDGKQEIYLEWPSNEPIKMYHTHLHLPMRGGYSRCQFSQYPRSFRSTSMYNLYDVVLMHTHGLAHGIIRGCI